MNNYRKRIICLAILSWLAVPAGVQAQIFKDQAASLTRTNPAFLKAFREVVAKPSESTVRIQSSGKDAALGMIVGPDGWILTKAYDLKGDLTVKLKDGKTYDARLVGVHRDHDVALLKIEASGLKPIDFTESKQVGVGNWLASVGMGDDPVAVGVVSVATRSVPVPKGGFSLPPDVSKRGYLGVELEQGEGHPVIKNVQKDTPAAKIGLKDKDLILSLNGQEMKEWEQFKDTIGKFKPGDEVTLKVRRGDVELELKPKLDRIPPGANRGDQQDRMGSELSERRSGYPTFLQHDSVVKPADCGGPIVDLKGRVIGINICRAGRTESWVVPTEAIQPLLFDMMAGKLPPKVEVAKLSLEQQLEVAKKVLQKAEAHKAAIEKKLADTKTLLAKLETDVKAAKALELAKTEKLPKPAVVTTPTPAKVDDAAVQQVDKLVTLMQQRLQLMKDVASAKWQAKQTDADAQREQELLVELVKQGEKAGLQADAVRGFFTAQFDVAKQVQQSHFDRFQKDKVQLKNVPDLQKDLRPKLDKVSQELVVTLAQLQPQLANPAVQQRLRDRAAAMLTGEGITDAIRNRAIEPLVKR